MKQNQTRLLFHCKTFNSITQSLKHSSSTRLKAKLVKLEFQTFNERILESLNQVDSAGLWTNQFILTCLVINNIFEFKNVNLINQYSHTKIWNKTKIYLICQDKNAKLSTEHLAFYHQNVKEELHAFNCCYRNNIYMSWQLGVIKTYKIVVQVTVIARVPCSQIQFTTVKLKQF